MFFRVVGNVCVALGLIGLVYLALASSGLFQPPEERSVVTLRPPSATAPEAAPAPSAEESPPAAEPPPITRVRLPRLGIDSDVVPSPFVQIGDSGTWEVPAFKVGHAEYTAGAGQTGNAVLFGHVTSRSLGNVFETLDRARRGDVVELSSGDEDFTYQVVEVKRVSRTDISVVEPTDTAFASLITCTGLWLPQLNDYAERLVVRAELMSS